MTYVQANMATIVRDFPAIVSHSAGGRLRALDAIADFRLLMPMVSEVFYIIYFGLLGNKL
jgi:hypothetical protein